MTAPITCRLLLRHELHQPQDGRVGDEVTRGQEIEGISRRGLRSSLDVFVVAQHEDERIAVQQCLRHRQCVRVAQMID